MAPETISDADMQRHFREGPRIKGAVLALVNDRIYKREGGVWRLLDNRVCHTTKELTDGPQAS